MSKLIDIDVINESYIVLEKLNLLEKIPEDVLNYLKANVVENYSFTVDVNIPLDLQIENENTKVYLSYLFLKYINDQKEEKEFLLDMYKENQVKEDKLIREKYNPDNIFKQNNSNEERELKENQEENKYVLVINEKISIFSKIKNFFKNLFKK